MCSGILTGIISKVWEGVIEKMQSILFLFYLKESDDASTYHYSILSDDGVMDVA